MGLKARRPECAASAPVSILILRGPQSEAAVEWPPQTLSGPVRAGLIERAASAGKAIALRCCRDERELVDCLRGMRAANTELLLLDPGACVPASAELRDALDALPMPYIEVHDDAMGALEPSIVPHCGPRLRLIHGYAAHSYTLALSIALEHLGCDECGNDIHVGT